MYPEIIQIVTGYRMVSTVHNTHGISTYRYSMKDSCHHTEHIWCARSTLIDNMAWKAMLWIRICRIRMFLGLLDQHPDPLVTSTVRIRILHHQAKTVRKTFRIRIRMFWASRIRIRIRTKLSRFHNSTRKCFTWGLLSLMSRIMMLSFSSDCRRKGTPQSLALKTGWRGNYVRLRSDIIY
jgi:hypothetical protein